MSAIPKRPPNRRGSAHTKFGYRASDGWTEYSRLKNEWIKKHPEASSREIDRAARAIALRLGL